MDEKILNPDMSDMTLLDFFAGQIWAGMIATNSYEDIDTDGPSRAYFLAGKLLKERESGLQTAVYVANKSDDGYNV